MVTWQQEYINKEGNSHNIQSAKKNDVHALISMST